MITPTFENIQNTVYDLKDIYPCDANGTKLTSCKNKLMVQKLNTSSGGVSGGYKYTTSSSKGWYRISDNQAIAAGEVPIYEGEGLYLYNTETSADIYINLSGAVTLTALSTPIAASSYMMLGNMTPVTVYLKQVKPWNVEGTAEETNCKNKLMAQKVNPATGGVTGGYKYTTASNKGWYRISDNQAIGDTEVPIEPGEAMYFSNSDASKAYTLKFPNPVQ